MIYILYALVAAVAVMLATYFLAPKVLYNMMNGLLRRRGRVTEKQVQAGDDIWPYLDGGQGDGPPVVLIHGFGGDKDNWSIYAPHITKSHRMIAPDLPGFGDNDRSLERDYDISSQVHRLNGFLDALNIPKCHLGGNSMGGFIALQFAMEYPEKVASLTLFNNAGVVGSEKSELQVAAESGKNVLALENLADVDRLLDFVSYKTTPMPKNFKKIFYQEAHEHKALLDKIFWQIAGSGINDPLNDRLGTVKAPTLIIWGRHDRLIDVSCVEALEKGIANSETLILEETGHVPMIEKPKETASRHLAFLAKN